MDLARALAKRSVMPCLGGLMDRAAVWGTDSPLPEVSPVCWTSMFSGQGPGGHGVFGFGEALANSYAVLPVDSGAVTTPRLWDLASRAGLKSVVLNVPLTYPARPLNGVMVSGFVTPELSRGVHPMEMLPRLKALGYRPEAELEAGVTDAAALLADVDAALAVRLELFNQMLDEPWDCYVGVITDSDRVNHFAWPALWQEDHPLARAALSVYRRMDDFIGQVAERFGAEIESGQTTLLIAADHSFGPIRSEVYMNRWLIEQGYLCLEGAPPQERILPATSALALDPGRVYLHWQGRFPGGWLQPGARAEELMGRIARGLMELSWQGQPVISQVHWGRELYQGPQAVRGPDLVAEAAPGFSLRGGLDKPAVFGTSHLTGAHRPSGALALCLPRPAERPATVAGLFGLMAKSLDLTSI